MAAIALGIAAIGSFFAGCVATVFIAAIGVPLLMLMIVAVAGNMIQHRLVFSAEALTPKFSKISPMAGAKRLFGKQALANFVKGLFKLVVLGAIMVAVDLPPDLLSDYHISSTLSPAYNNGVASVAVPTYWAMSSRLMSICCFPLSLLNLL